MKNAWIVAIFVVVALVLVKNLQGSGGSNPAVLSTQRGIFGTDSFRATDA